MSYWPWYEYAWRNLKYEHAHKFIEKYFKILLYEMCTIQYREKYDKVNFIGLEDSLEIYFIFFWALLYFLRILEVYMNFCNYKRKQKN
jgi:hypothetical protein